MMVRSLTSLMVPATVKRASLQVAAAILFLVLAGATYQGVATAVERRSFPRPGGMVDVGGHQLHIACTGTGSPTVVLEAPAGGMSAAWGTVQPLVAEETRVCSYDRAGLGWSERADAPYAAETVAVQLQRLLARSNVAPPFVVAGQGLGAAYARLFAARSGRDTAALVLIDDPAAERPRSSDGRVLQFPAALPWLARVGALRASGALSWHGDRLGEPAGSVLRAFLNRPDHMTRTADELREWRRTVTLAVNGTTEAAAPVTRLDIAGQDAVAFVPDDQAPAVAAAILGAVRSVRAAAPAASRPAASAAAATPGGP